MATSGSKASQQIRGIVSRLKLGDVVRIYVPSRDRLGRPLKHDSLVRVVEQALVDAAGGATSLVGEGLWQNGRGIPVRERIRLIESHFVHPITVQSRVALRHCLEVLTRDSHQDAIAVEVNGHLHFLSDDSSNSQALTLHELPGSGSNAPHLHARR